MAAFSPRSRAIWAWSWLRSVVLASMRSSRAVRARWRLPMASSTVEMPGISGWVALRRAWISGSGVDSVGFVMFCMLYVADAGRKDYDQIYG